MTQTRRLKNVLFIEKICEKKSFVPSKRIRNVFNDIERIYGNVTVKDFQKHEKLEYKNNKLKLGIISTIANNLVCIRNYLSLNCRMFLIKTLYQFVKDSIVAPSTSVIKNSQIFQINSVYLKTFYLHSFLLLTSTSLQNL